MTIERFEARVTGGRALYAPPTEAESFSRHMYARPAETETLLGSLADRFDLYCDIVGLDAHAPAVLHRRDRTLYKAVSAPLFHEIELAADRRFLAAQRNDVLDLARYTKNLQFGHRSGFPFEGAYADYVAIESAVNLRATSDVLDDILSSDRHPLLPIWEAYAEIAPKFAASERQVRGYSRPLDPVESLTGVTGVLGEDTMLPFVMQCALYFKQKRKPDADELTALLLAKSERLSWGSTLSRHVRINAFPDAGAAAGTTAACPFIFCAQGVIQENVQNEGLWVRTDIVNGPREPSSFCPAANMVELSPRTVQDVYTVEDMLATRGVARLLAYETGAAAASELHLARSIALMGKTVLRTL